MDGWDGIWHVVLALVGGGASGGLLVKLLDWSIARRQQTVTESETARKGRKDDITFIVDQYRQQITQLNARLLDTELAMKVTKKKYAEKEAQCVLLQLKLNEHEKTRAQESPP